MGGAGWGRSRVGYHLKYSSPTANWKGVTFLFRELRPSAAGQGSMMGAMARSGFGERLKALLEERDMSQVGLSRLLHLGKSTISQYISGVRNPDIATLKAVAEAFSVSTDYLLGRTEVRWPAVFKEPDLELVLDGAGELGPEDRRRLLDYLEYLRFQRRRKTRTGKRPGPPTETR